MSELSDRYTIIPQGKLDVVTCKDCGLGPVMVLTWHEKFHDRLDAISRMAVKGESAWSFNQPLG